ncbi:MAG: mercury methylation ferredoxin HgcB [Methanoregula sp.]|jgi:NAD-dependent dihydropyrimidine dehydrogenase PreA subunit
MSGSGKVQQNPDEKKNQSGFFDSYTETSLKYYPERCINCKRCTQVCPHAVFAEGKDHVDLAQPASCMECGACALNCPVQAIEVQSGVGCAWAMISAALRGKDMDTECSCGGDDGSCCGQSQEPSCGCEEK